MSRFHQRTYVLFTKLIYQIFLFVCSEQQLKLWIPLLGMIFMLSVFIWFCRTDEACCDVEKPCLYRFGCKKKKKKG